MSDLATQLASLSPVKRALLQRLSRSGTGVAEPIAVVGMACRFPGANTLDAFWDVIANGRNLSRQIPEGRFDVDAFYDPAPDTPGRMATKWACLVDDVDQFDPVFFGITPREASRMDPQQRLLLHTCWEAIENAAIDTATLSRSPTGVYVGVGQMDYPRAMSHFDNSIYALDAHCGTGQALSICANRLSYIFNWTGPSLSIDTACSSGLVAIDSAVQSLRKGDCDTAVAGGVNVCLTPEAFISLSKARMLSPTGACRPFDARADGYVRGEGCGVVILKRLSDAIEAGDRVQAIVRGTAVNHCGRTSGITAPSGRAQQRVIRSALANAGVDSQDVEYLEAHGTGTPLGDPIEIESIGETFSRLSDDVPPLYVTSVKANIGHTEIAAGIAGFIKTVLVLKNELIPPQIELDQFNPHLRFDRSRITIPREPRRWRQDHDRLAGVSSFGFGGTNAHVVLQSSPNSKVDAGSNGSGRGLQVHTENLQSPPRLLPLSAKTTAALKQSAGDYASFIENADETFLEDVIFTAAQGRTHFEQRAVVLGDDREQLVEGLRRLEAGRRRDSVRCGRANEAGVHGIAAMFTGQGSQYARMGEGLYNSQPAYRKAMDRCDAIVRQHRGQSLLPIIAAESEASVLGETRWTQPALFALAYSLYQLWKSWGIRPTALIGHSVGEYVAATIAGVFDLETGMQLICRRGELMQTLPAGGAMAVVFAAGEDVANWIAPYNKHLSIAAFNGPSNTTLSGSASAIDAAIKGLQREGVAVKRLDVSHAFHSSLMDPILDDFESFAAKFDYQKPEIPIAANGTGKLETDAIFDATYWRNHIRDAVRFAQGIDALKESGIGATVEIGPSAALTGMANRCQPEWRPVAAASLRPESEDRWTIMQAAADLHLGGVTLDWSAIDRPKYQPQRVTVPGHPMDRKPYWFRPENATRRYYDFITAASHVSPVLGSRVPTPSAIMFESRLETFLPKHIGDHVVLGDAVVPGSAYVEAALSAAREVFDEPIVSVENVTLQKAMFLSSGPRTMQTHVTGSDSKRRTVRIYSRPVDAADDVLWDLNATLSISRNTPAPPPPIDAQQAKAGHGVHLDREQFYRVVSERGLHYGKAFQVVDGMWRSDDQVYVTASCIDSVETDRDAFTLHPVVGDGCMQSMVGAVALEADGSFSPDLYLPISIDRVTVWSDVTGPIAYHVRRTSPDTGPGPESVTANVTILRESDGEPLAYLEGVCIRRVREQADDASDQPANWLYRVSWCESPIPSANSTEVVSSSTRYIIIGEGTQAKSIESALLARGVDVMLHRDRKLTDSPDSFTMMLREAAADTRPLHLILARGLQVDSLETGQRVWTDTFALLKLLQHATFLAPIATTIITRGARATGNDDAPFVDCNQAPLIGLGQVAAQELRGCNVRLLDLDPVELDSARDNQTPKEDATPWIADLLHPSFEPAIAYRGDKRLVPRLAPTPEALRDDRYSASVPNASAYRLRLGTENSIDGLKFEKVQRHEPRSGEIEIEVAAAGLNFSDVLKAIGLYPGITDDVVPLGLECSGRVTAVGKDVSRWRVGDEVVGITPAGFASHCITSERAVVRKPESLDDEEAAVIPIAYMTALYSLRDIARLRPGERVLIHAGAGGVGLAAIQIAKSIGAEIVATAGSEEKRDFLRSLGIRHVMNSRTLDFADQIRAEVGGVDVVLNSLPGDAIDASLSCLAPYGRFVEIGKTDIYSGKPLKLTPFQDNLTYSAVDLDRLFRQRPEVAAELLADVVKAFDEGTYAPPEVTVFPIDDVRDAFRFMSQRKNIGKIAVLIDPPATVAEQETESPTIRADGTYLITGGLGALGLATAKWLVQRGAGSVVLLSRRPANAATEQVLDELNRSPTRVVAIQADVCDRESLLAAVNQLKSQHPPLCGVLHAAGVLRDRLISSMSVDDFEHPLPAKTLGTLNLAAVTEQSDLDFMVLFSSASSVFGTGGQANYGAANAFLDAFAERRNASGRRTLAINWGAFDGGGMASDLADMMRSQGVRLLPVESSLALMDPLIRAEASRLTVFRADWSRYGGLLRSVMSGDLKYSLLDNVAGQHESESSSEAMSIRDEILGQSAEMMKEHLQGFFVAQLSEIMGIDPEDIDPQSTLTSLGMDSLMAIELGNKMQSALQIELPMSVYLEGPTVEKLADYVVGVFEKHEDSPETTVESTSREVVL